MIKSWDDFAWEDYLYWQTQDKKTLKRINQLLQDIDRNGYTGIGKPEPLKGDMAGYWSRRIDEVNRLVYRIVDNRIEVLQCRSHYGNKLAVKCLSEYPYSSPSQINSFLGGERAFSPFAFSYYFKTAKIIPIFIHCKDKKIATIQKRMTIKCHSMASYGLYFLIFLIFRKYRPRTMSSSIASIHRDTSNHFKLYYLLSRLNSSLPLF